MDMPRYKLFTEGIEEVRFVKEGEGDTPKRLYVEGIFLQGDIKNRNGRVYPKNVLAKEVGRYMKEHVDRRIAYGELGHPEGPTINPDRISHLITSLKEDGSNYIGKALVLETPLGKIAAELISEGGLAVSSRGLGSVVRVGDSMQVQEDFKLATAADFVINPSAPDAFVEGLMEGVEWIWNPVKNTWMAEQIANEFRNTSPKKINEEVLIKNWSLFLKTL